MSFKDAAIDCAWSWASSWGPTTRRMIPKIVAGIAHRWPSRPMRAWAANAELITGHACDRKLISHAYTSWTRNLVESVTLANWTPEQITSSVIIDDDDFERLAAARNGRPMIFALAHMGSWDLCGAWAATQGIRVSSVAQRLDDARFERFLDARRALGMNIYTADDPNVFQSLERDLDEGRTVCLLSDRNLSKRAVSVNWPVADGVVKVQVPPGVAALAKRSKAPIATVTSTYEGDHMRVRVGEPFDYMGVDATMQRVVDELSKAIADNVGDWLVMGRFFKAS